MSQPGKKQASPSFINDEEQAVKTQANSLNYDERRTNALAKLDNAKFSWSHAKVVLVVGVGFLTDAYDTFAINIASVMIGYVYSPGHMTTANQDLGLKVATPIGTLVGQLYFGWLADVVGRKRMYGVELVIIIVGTFGQALSGPAHGVNLFGVLIVWRFIMGVGIGGDCPLSAIISSEIAPTHIRGRLMTTVCALQGWGNFAAALVALITTFAFKSAILADDPAVLAHVDNMWRILIGLGCIPGALALYFRLTIPETPRFTMDIERNVSQASDDVENFLTTGNFSADRNAVVQRVDAPKASFSDFSEYFSQWKNLKILIGCSWSWFALNTAVYGLGLNSSIVLTAIGFNGSSASGTTKVFETLKNIGIGNLILAAAGLIPGYWAALRFIDIWGRKPIQLMGFVMLTMLFVTLGFAYDKLVATTETRNAFVFLYCLANFFQNFGPNTTTFIIPGEVFPTRYRSTCHGIAAASGKLGAILAQVGFARLKDFGGTNQSVKHILKGFAFFMFTGIFSTLLLPETKGKTLEELSNEDQEGFVKGISKSEESVATEVVTCASIPRICLF